ncbi:helix-turn-helix domain-containing protein [Rhodococcus opacus]|uniref:Insertion element IS150 protein InsJ-like helix-turn-helix domain-containing protein n=1 Tax=Rhodococcus opacus TaxID=37919 RepID=A0A2S8J8R9_RHOOP|nr:hypothetical protein C5613_19150 [Rhodococcus opacus]
MACLSPTTNRRFLCPDTFHGKVLIVDRYREGWPKAHIAAAMGISRKCVSRWISRYETDGDAGLHDRSSRPLRCQPEPAPRPSRRWSTFEGSNDAVRTGSVPNSASLPHCQSDHASPQDAGQNFDQPGTSSGVRLGLRGDGFDTRTP